MYTIFMRIPCVDVSKIPKFKETLQYFTKHCSRAERRGIISYNDSRRMTINQFQGTVRIKFRHALGINDELIITLRKSKIELTYLVYDDELVPLVQHTENGSLPVLDSGAEILEQYIFIDDTFGIDYESFQCIIEIHTKNYDRLRDRLI